MIDVNPAKVGVDNPVRRRKEQHPFESWDELESIAAAIGPRYGPMILFAAATGLRPAEWIALEKRDVDCKERVVFVRRPFTRGVLKIPKTEASTRAVPLQARALDALDRICSNGSPLLFPGERVAISTSTTSAPTSGDPHRKPQVSNRSGGSTISDTPSRPSRSAPASQPSTSRATWAPA